MAMLEATDVSKSFGGIVALAGVSLTMDDGEAVAVVGPNGAGKTTLFNCLLGLVRPDTGTVFFDGARIDRMPTYRRSRLGIGRTFQRLELFAGMTPRQHLLVTERVGHGGGHLWRDLVGLGLPSPDERAAVDELLALVGLTDRADVPVEALSLGVGRLVEPGSGIFGEHTAGRFSERDRFGFERRKRGGDARHGLVDGNHLRNMSSTRARAASASFSAASGERPRERPVR